MVNFRVVYCNSININNILINYKKFSNNNNPVIRVKNQNKKINDIINEYEEKIQKIKLDYEFIVEEVKKENCLLKSNFEKEIKQIKLNNENKINMIY